MKKMIFVGLLVPCAIVLADQINLPHTFAAGGKAKAAEVNSNFSALVTESNAQDNRLNSQESRLAALEGVSAPTVSDQLICVAYYNWPIDGSSYSCVQASNPSNIRSMTYAQVAAENWIAVSVGGDGSNRVAYIFSK
ncbi:hypothetical protein [Povalibacter sp.]|uniref:hypothetical protein n=1 Tax=Povalibacter sp. TaxID=1962978 RepID=UPI002F3E5405